MIGHRVSLASHQDYRGGLDTQFVQTGEQSVYTEHCDKEVMYKRKRNIDNDVVFIVIQLLSPSCSFHGVDPYQAH